MNRTAPSPAGRRAAMLELAVLGLLDDSPMHGYELRKRVNSILGPLRTLSFGTLYPRLAALVAAGLITECDPAAPGPCGSPAEADPALARTSRRNRIVYRLTDAGKAELHRRLTTPGPGAWEDEDFHVHYALFGRTTHDVRLRILEGRRSRLEERLDAYRASTSEGRDHADAYTAELARHGLESTERELAWLRGLIEAEHHGRPGPEAAQPHSSTHGYNNKE